MTRKDILRLVVLQARAGGFEFRKWYQAHIDPEWSGFQAAIDTLSAGGRYYALLFSHDFAQSFWKPGSPIHFVVPTTEYTRLDSTGNLITVKRKPYTRRTAKTGVWEYHLREMSASSEPLRYIRRFLPTAEELNPEADLE